MAIRLKWGAINGNDCNYCHVNKGKPSNSRVSCREENLETAGSGTVAPLKDSGFKNRRSAVSGWLSWLSV